MNKVAFVFSGQGSQYVGMGQDFYESNSEVKALYDLANEVLDDDLAKLCFEGPIENLSKTSNTQPAILTHSIACLLVLQQYGIKSEAMLGFSLGEYSALVASGAIDFKTCLQVIAKRAKLMENAVSKVDSVMAAVIGLSYEEVSLVVAGLCEVSNYNSSKQIIIGGLRDNVLEAIDKFGDDVKVKLLNVSGAFHTSLLNEASLAFENYLVDINFTKPEVDVLSNYTNEYYDEIDKKVLSMQMNHTVRLYENISKLLDDGYTTFIELGPGKVLTMLIKSICKEKRIDATVLNVENEKTLNRTLKKLEEQNA